jgi:glucokinase
LFGFLQGKKYVLVADIGGTNANFAVVDNQFNILVKTSYNTSQYATFEDSLRAFLKEPYLKNIKLNGACFAMAGPINRDRTFGEFTNLPWTINVPELKKNFHFERILLINDFEAIGFAIDIMKKEQYMELTARGRDKDGVITVMGAGTGLGLGILYPVVDHNNHTYHLPLASEFSKADLFVDPDNKLELDLFKYLAKNKIILEQESILSGRGIATIYDFLRTKKIKHSKEASKQINASKDKQKLIVKFALEDKDVLCTRTVEMFSRYYARTAKNLVLTTLCSELIMAGGIAPKIAPILSEVFMGSFIDHDRTQAKQIIENATVLVITDYSISLYGAANALNHADRM